MRDVYQRQMLAIRAAFEAGAMGLETVRRRSDAVDTVLRMLWRPAEGSDGPGIAVLAVGGYGRRELFPYSDVDVLFVSKDKSLGPEAKERIRGVTQSLWDLGLRVSPQTRWLDECARMDSRNTEFSLALLDARGLAGDAALSEHMITKTLPALIERERRTLTAQLAEITSARHRKYGGTLFHLEPNVKDGPGGLRDAHVCRWLERLWRGQGLGRGEGTEWRVDEEFEASVEFLTRVRCFLHYQHQRDNNTLDWTMQDAAAEAAIGIGRPARKDAALARPDAAYWMRLYFRNARSIDRYVARMLEETAIETPRRAAPQRLKPLRAFSDEERPMRGFTLEQGRIVLDAATEGGFLDPAGDPDVALAVFAAMARDGFGLSHASEERLSNALPRLAANLDEGLALWVRLREILTGVQAGDALRAMHALGLLELLVPEFHGIDALVIRDAYHRYTVDEHTFVLIDTLHGLEAASSGALGEWAAKMRLLLGELPRPELLYLSALLHDTGKGRTGDGQSAAVAHTRESARMAEGVLARLELDAYEACLVEELILNHVEMSAALRRDIFDEETVRGFADKVKTPEMLRMLTLFTYADIQAVHPDALTPWKAENLWRLYMATANFLDRSVDEHRVRTESEGNLVLQVASRMPTRHAEVAAYLDGFPERYTKTRKAEQIRAHFELTERFAEDPVQFHFRYAPEMSELTLVTPDREALFANVTGVLAAWGMNIVSADAFSNRQGIVVDSFRFTDGFKTLEMNPEERDRMVANARDVMRGVLPLERLLSGRRRPTRRAAKVEVETRIDFDDKASSKSTLLQVVTHDSPGLLRALSTTLAEERCNIEVALIDTEGERAIDVFYLTVGGEKLPAETKARLEAALAKAIEDNALER